MTIPSTSSPPATSEITSLSAKTVQVLETGTALRARDTSSTTSPGEVVELASRARLAVPVSSTCTVFAESEVISLVAGGEPVEGIVKGLHQSLASRVAALARGTAGAGELFMSGGVALNGAMVAALQEALGRPVRIVPDPQLVGALGAALAVLPAAGG